MIRRSTVVYIVILLAVIGTYFYFKNREQQPVEDPSVTPEATATETRYLFNAEEGIATSIRIIAKTGETVGVTRDATNAWMLTTPVEAKADAAAAEAAASQVSSLRVLDSISNIDLDLVGTSIPDYMLNITFDSGVERTIKVGVVTPTESGYYVQDASGGDVLIVSKSSLDPLLGLLTMPPYLETPTASPIPTETALPSDTPEAGATPNETVTPQS
jgi:hypothetical protein